MDGDAAVALFCQELILPSDDDNDDHDMDQYYDEFTSVALML